MFSAAKTFAQYQEVSNLLIDQDNKPRTWQSFKDEALKIHKQYNLNYLKTEFRTAQRSALMAGKWADAERTKHLYDLMFETAGDEKVRHDHSALNGIVRPVDDGFWKTYSPPLDWNCRCGFRKVAKGTAITPSTKLQRLTKPDKQFRFNPGQQKLIFSTEHPYIQNLKTNKKRQLQAVKDYGLPSTKKIYAKGKFISKSIKEFSEKQQAKDWFTKLSTNGNLKITSKIGDTKYNTILNQKQFNHIVDDNNDKRWMWVKELPKVLLTPNEVFLLNYKIGKRTNSKETYRFIKYYKNRKLIANVEIGDELIIKTAYEMIDEVNERVGVLLHTKK